MILLIDNYDSFVYNLHRYFIRLGQEVLVVRNDHLDLEDSAIGNYSAIVISPGPQSPDQAGVSLELIRRYHQRVPMLGVCLGHQAIWQALGGRIVRAKMPMHGRSSPVRYSQSPMFESISNPFMAARYHSLAADASTKPAELRITAWSDDQEVMAFEHEKHPVFGLQFHPESILTTCGYQLLRNFLMLAKVPNVPSELPANDLTETDLRADESFPNSDPPSKSSSDDCGPIAVFPGSSW